MYTCTCTCTHMYNYMCVHVHYAPVCVSVCILQADCVWISRCCGHYVWEYLHGNITTPCWHNSTHSSTPSFSCSATPHPPPPSPITACQNHTSLSLHHHLLFYLLYTSLPSHHTHFTRSSLLTSLPPHTPHSPPSPRLTPSQEHQCGWLLLQLLQQHCSDHAQICSLGLDVHSLQSLWAWGHGLHRIEKDTSTFSPLVSQSYLFVSLFFLLYSLAPPPPPPPPVSFLLFSFSFFFHIYFPLLPSLFLSLTYPFSLVYFPSSLPSLPHHLSLPHSHISKSSWILLSAPHHPPFTHLDHRYHHITVFIFTWYAISGLTAQVHWFGCLNYTVHSLMYSYYGLRAYGYRPPSAVAKFITALQLSQMFLGIIVNGVAFRATLRGETCTFYWDIFYLGIAMYTSYAILFMNFFYQRYIRKSPKKAKKQ